MLTAVCLGPVIPRLPYTLSTSDGPTLPPLDVESAIISNYNNKNNNHNLNHSQAANRIKLAKSSSANGAPLAGDGKMG